MFLSPHVRMRFEYEWEISQPVPCLMWAKIFGCWITMHSVLGYFPSVMFSVCMTIWRWVPPAYIVILLRTTSLRLLLINELSKHYQMNETRNSCYGPNNVTRLFVRLKYAWMYEHVWMRQNSSSYSRMNSLEWPVFYFMWMFYFM